MYTNVDAELKRKNMTRGQLAERLNITASTMSLKLNGKSNISLAEAMEIKTILNVDIPLEELFKPFSGPL